MSADQNTNTLIKSLEEIVQRYRVSHEELVRGWAVKTKELAETKTALDSCRMNLASTTEALQTTIDNLNKVVRERDELRKVNDYLITARYAAEASGVKALERTHSLASDLRTLRKHHFIVCGRLKTLRDALIAINVSADEALDEVGAYETEDDEEDDETI